jgi:hypothetical protein
MVSAPGQREDERDQRTNHVKYNQSIVDAAALGHDQARPQPHADDDPCARYQNGAENNHAPSSRRGVDIVDLGRPAEDDFYRGVQSARHREVNCRDRRAPCRGGRAVLTEPGFPRGRLHAGENVKAPQVLEKFPRMGGGGETGPQRVKKATMLDSSLSTGLVAKPSLRPCHSPNFNLISDAFGALRTHAILRQGRNMRRDGDNSFINAVCVSTPHRAWLHRLERSRASLT